MMPADSTPEARIKRADVIRMLFWIVFPAVLFSSFGWSGTVTQLTVANDDNKQDTWARVRQVLTDWHALAWSASDCTRIQNAHAALPRLNVTVRVPDKYGAAMQSGYYFCSDPYHRMAEYNQCSGNSEVVDCASQSQPAPCSSAITTKVALCFNQQIREGFLDSIADLQNALAWLEAAPRTPQS